MENAHAESHDLQRHIRGYLIVFGVLLAMTAVTVGISYLHLPVTIAIILALVVAIFKAGLVALYFMHLISERFIIYAVLIFVAVNFLGMILLIYYGYFDIIQGTKYVS